MNESAAAPRCSISGRRGDGATPKEPLAGFCDPCKA
jgi:hypothetical protein